MIRLKQGKKVLNKNKDKIKIWKQAKYINVSFVAKQIAKLLEKQEKEN
ncbi:unnamed protein product [marine sediment metagenome]|uniref:Uncharacterized protein n=1 Tax=marine sediment metagenome TaxID=412755 RepID=X1G4U3_9ZZZZ